MCNYRYQAPSCCSAYNIQKREECGDKARFILHCMYIQIIMLSCFSVCIWEKLRDLSFSLCMVEYAECMLTLVHVRVCILWHALTECVCSLWWLLFVLVCIYYWNVCIVCVEQSHFTITRLSGQHLTADHTLMYKCSTVYSVCTCTCLVCCICVYMYMYVHSCNTLNSACTKLIYWHAFISFTHTHTHAHTHTHTHTHTSSLQPSVKWF